MRVRRRRRSPVCPHCRGYARVRTSEQHTPIYSTALIECQSPECGWRGTLSLEVTQTLTPSLTPDPEIDLPVNPLTRKRLLEQLRAELS